MCLNFSVHAWRDSGRKNHPIHLKFVIKVYVLYENSYICCGMRCLINTYTEITNRVSKHYSLQKGNSLKSFLTWLLSIKFNKIYMGYLQCLFRKFLYNGKFAQDQRHTKE